MNSDKITDNNKAPGLLLIGPGRSGTTSLFNFLSTHRELIPSKIKETNFFTPLLLNESPGGLEDYLDLFRYRDTPGIRFEATPSYFLGGRSIAETINKLCPRAFAVIVLRDPVDKFVSSYNHYRTKLDVNSTLSLEEYFYLCKDFTPCDLNNLKDMYKLSIYEGHYLDRLDEWLSIFGTKRVLLFFYEELVKNPQIIIRGISDAIGIEPLGFNDSEFLKTNASSGFKNSSLHRIAMKANLVFEPFLNIHPGVKQTFKKWYAMINSSPLSDRELSSEVLHLVQDEYKESNKRLYRYLKRMGKNNLPMWVKKSYPM